MCSRRRRQNFIEKLGGSLDSLPSHTNEKNGNEVSKLSVGMPVAPAVKMSSSISSHTSSMKISTETASNGALIETLPAQVPMCPPRRSHPISRRSLELSPQEPASLSMRLSRSSNVLLNATVSTQFTERSSLIGNTLEQLMLAVID